MLKPNLHIPAAAWPHHGGPAPAWHRGIRRDSRHWRSQRLEILARRIRSPGPCLFLLSKEEVAKSPRLKLSWGFWTSQDSGVSHPTFLKSRRGQQQALFQRNKQEGKGFTGHLPNADTDNISNMSIILTVSNSFTTPIWTVFGDCFWSIFPGNDLPSKNTHRTGARGITEMAHPSMLIKTKLSPFNTYHGE